MTESTLISRDELHGALASFPTRTLGVLVFPGFQALDLWGPIEMFGNAAPAITPILIGADDQPISSAQGPRVIVDTTMEESPRLDLVLIPGGNVAGQKHNAETVEWIRWQAADAEIVMSVCNGSDLLAETGLLDGRRATTNKALFTSIAANHPRVNWVARARWVDDGKFVTSSGVSAGIDMSLAVLDRLVGDQVSDGLAAYTEYSRHHDPRWDPFAGLHGLAPPTLGD